MTAQTTNIRQAYKASVALVDSYGYVAYEVIPLDGAWHVTHDPQSGSYSIHESYNAACQEATAVNQRLVASLQR